MPAPPEFTPSLKEIRGAQRAESSETTVNPRARSAVLRVAEKLGAEVMA
jgi:16S rRNA (cytosine1402-N4)-methyltransferase